MALVVDGALDVGRGHEALLQVRLPAHPRPAVALVQLDDAQLLSVVHRDRALARRWPEVPPLVLVGPRVTAASGVGAPRIVSTGYIETREIRALMSASACLALVSFEEGFGFPVVEAMAAGLPVVCSRGSSLSEIAGSAAEFVDPLDIPGIADALESVLRSAQRARELRALGLERSRLFDWNRTAEMTLAFYRRVLGS